ncbi:MAG: S1 RNA-binding domain-containing protein [Pseudonocardiales bacterium]|nr:S1 RNA-binding domain-containing protein [Pseudonocardiales bacterium]
MSVIEDNESIGRRFLALVSEHDMPQRQKLLVLRQSHSYVGRSGRRNHSQRYRSSPPWMTSSARRIVTNVAAFGAFVDVGVHHNPPDVVPPGDVVRAKVLAVDVPRHRIGLSLRLDGPTAGAPSKGS